MTSIMSYLIQSWCMSPFNCSWPFASLVSNMQQNDQITYNAIQYSTAQHNTIQYNYLHHNMKIEFLKVILYSYLILKKLNERTTDS